MIENKTAMIFAMVKPSEKKYIDAIAKKNNMRTSDYVRSVMLGKIKGDEK